MICPLEIAHDLSALQAVRVVGIRKGQPRGGSKNAARNQFHVWNSVWPIHLFGRMRDHSSWFKLLREEDGTLNHYVRDLLRRALADQMTAHPLHSHLPGDWSGLRGS